MSVEVADALLRLKADESLQARYDELASKNTESALTPEEKRGGRPSIRRMRITLADVLGWLATGISHQEIRDDFPELTEEDIRACLEYAADRERRLVTVTS